VVRVQKREIVQISVIKSNLIKPAGPETLILPSNHWLWPKGKCPNS
jgi:hypothetical protein